MAKDVYKRQDKDKEGKVLAVNKKDGKVLVELSLIHIWLVLLTRKKRLSQKTRAAKKKSHTEMV